MPVARDTMGIWTMASWGAMSGSYPLPEVVTRSGVGSTPSRCQYCTSSRVLSSSTLERGPRLLAPDSPGTPFASKGLSPPETFSLGLAAYGPVSSGRPWNHLGLVQFWPMSVDPVGVMEPSTLLLKASREMSVPR